MRVAELVRRELMPELRHLENQMEKISKVELEREKLLGALIKYFSYEDNYINDLKNKLGANINFEGENFETKRAEIENNISILNKKEIELSAPNIKNNEDKIFEEKIRDDKNNLDIEKTKIQNEMSVIVYEKNNLLSKLNNEVKVIEIKKEVFVNLKSDIKYRLNNIKNNLDSNNILEIKNNLRELEDIILSTDAWHDGVLDKTNIENNLVNLNTKLENFDTQLRDIREKISKLDSDMRIRNENSNNQKLIEIKKIYEEKYKLERELSSIENNKESYERELTNLKSRDEDFNCNMV